VAGSLAERPSDLICDGHCEKWLAMAEAVMAAMVVKAVDIVCNVVEMIAVTFICCMENETIPTVGHAVVEAALPLSDGTAGDEVVRGAVHAGVQGAIRESPGLAIAMGVTVTVVADVLLPLTSMYYLGRSADVADEFVESHCFQDGRGLYHMVGIRDSLAGAWLNGYMIVQIFAGSTGLVLHVLDLFEKDEDKSMKYKCFIFLASCLSCMVDMADYWKNMKPNSDYLSEIEGVVLGNGTFSDKSKCAVYWSPTGGANYTQGYTTGNQILASLGVLLFVLLVGVCLRRCR